MIDRRLCCREKPTMSAAIVAHDVNVDTPTGWSRFTTRMQLIALIRGRLSAEERPSGLGRVDVKQKRLSSAIIDAAKPCTVWGEAKLMIVALISA